MDKLRKKKKGFTLIELIIVIAILGILALIAIPKFGSAQKDAKINADIATGKTIADAAAVALAKGDIVVGNEVIARKPIDDTAYKNVKSHLGSDTLKVQSVSGAKFEVEVLADGNVQVYVKGENPKIDCQVYPDSSKYKDEVNKVK